MGFVVFVVVVVVCLLLLLLLFFVVVIVVDLGEGCPMIVLYDTVLICCRIILEREMKRSLKMDHLFVIT